MRSSTLRRAKGTSMSRQVNISNADRVVRFILGGAVLGFGIAFGPMGTLVGAPFAAVLWLSAYMGYCHVHKVLGISTLKR